MSQDVRYEEARIEDVLEGRYTLRRQIARGGQAAVFEAEHGMTRARVAVKALIRPALDVADAHERLIREGRILGAVRHPNVVAIHDAGICAKHGPYLVLDMIEGRPLDGILLTRQKLPVGQAVAVLVQLCDALSEVHRHRVIHRDVKPGNLLIASSRSGDRVQLIDFGVATVPSDEAARKLTKTGEILGTVEYMSPEQLMGTSIPDQRSDVYSAGVVLYECLTGEVPHSGGPTVVMANMLAGTRPIPVRSKREDVSRALEIVVMKALEIDPSKRYASTAELARAATASFAQAVPTIDLLDVRDDRKEARQAATRSAVPPVAVASGAIATGAIASGARPPAVPEAARRRQYARAPYITPIRVIMEGGESADGRTEDISEGGILMIIEGACADGQHVHVRLVVPLSGKVVELEGVTKWIKTRGGQRAIGLQFVALPDEVRAEIRSYTALMTGGAAPAPPVISG